MEPEALAVRRELGDDAVPLWAENALAAFRIDHACKALSTVTGT